MGKHTGAFLELVGDRQLEKKLLALSKTSQTRVAKPALRAALKTIAKAQKGAAPLPVIKRSIGWRLNKSKRTGEEMGKAGVEVGKKTPRPKKTGSATNLRGRAASWLGHIFTLGTKVRTAGFTTRAKGHRGETVATGKPIANRGQIRANKFLKAATSSALPAALANAAAVAKDKLAEEASK